MKTLRAICLALGLLGFFSCSLGHPATQVLELKLPCPPSNRACLGAEDWILSWRDGEGRPSLAHVEAGGRKTIVVARGMPQSILAKPCLGGGGAGIRYPGGAGMSLAPAGPAFFQWGGVKVELGFEEGWLAEVCETLEAWGLDPEAFNLPRLRLELGARAQDPWLLPPQEAARLLAQKRFRADLLDPPDMRDVLLPGPGPWAPWSPRAAQPQAEGEAWKVSLAEGTWLFVSKEENLLVELRPGEEALWVRLPPGGG